MNVVNKPLSPARGDFYHISAILSEEDQELLFRVRAFMEAEVAPIINQFWIREEFPFQLIPGLAELNITGLGYHGYSCDGNGECRLFDCYFHGRPQRLSDGFHLPLRFRRAETTVAALYEAF